MVSKRKLSKLGVDMFYDPTLYIIEWWVICGMLD